MIQQWSNRFRIESKGLCEYPLLGNDKSKGSQWVVYNATHVDVYETKGSPCKISNSTFLAILTDKDFPDLVFTTHLSLNKCTKLHGTANSLS